MSAWTSGGDSCLAPVVVKVAFAGEVKAQLSSLKGRNKLALLQQQLKSIQENAKSAEQVCSCSCSCSCTASL